MKSIGCILLVMLLFPCSCKERHNQLTPDNLQCEYLVDPIGIDAQKPRFTWQIKSERQGVLQQEYRLYVGTNAAEVAAGKGNVWDSGIVKSPVIPAVYYGPELKPFTTYFWAVQIRDEKGQWSKLSPTASFETGMMEQDNWLGDWITDTYNYNVKSSPYFRREFETGKKIKSARAYIAVAGLYELYVNGERIGDHRLDPMYTRFDRRTLYVSYDVTNYLQTGENAFGVLLGNGWYNHHSTAVWYFDKAPWRARPKFCMDVRIAYEDGTQEVIKTARDWKTSPSPIILNSIYTAEHYDARLEQPGWNKTGFDDSEWGNVLLTGVPSKNITAQALQPIRNVEEIPAKEMVKVNNRTYQYNFGRNIAGVCGISVSGPEGTVIRLQHAEQLDKNGHLDIKKIDQHYRPTDESDPFQTDIFILKGNGTETFMPRFNYKGFQYVEVTADKPLQLTEESLTAYFMHSDVPPIGNVQTSNPMVDKIWQAANVSYLSNLFGYPTDCPQREKNGWTGDAHIAIETGLYNFDGITVYEKWLADHRDEQLPNGVLPAIIPTSGWGYHWANGPDWTSTIAIIPWNIYLFYGDSQLLKDCYDNIRRYVDHIDSISPTGITYWGLGDWIPVKSKTPLEFTSTAYYYADVIILAKTAKMLEKQADYEKYTALAEKIKSAFNAKYLNPDTGIYGSGFQTELSAALFWGLVPEEFKGKVAKNLAERVIADDTHVDVGLLGSKTIFNALSENGYADLAYEAASQETFPSWGWWIVNGATTLYESWDLGASSLNHIMFGEISAWYYKGLGGIFPDESQPGFKNVILKPNFVSGLDRFECFHDGPYGRIVSSWHKTNGSLTYTVSIPPNSTATLFLTADQLQESGKDVAENTFISSEKIGDKGYRLSLGSGTYNFMIQGL